MNRKNFIKTSLVASASIPLLSSFLAANFQDPIFSRDQLIGKGNPDISGASYTSTMHTATTAALKKMSVAAAAAGYKVEVVSAYRSFQRQKEIYEGKYLKFTEQGLSPLEAIKKIIEYSTIPGTSRHHWGTDLDIIDGNAPRPQSLLQAKNFHGNGPFCRFKEWLDHHAESFGFFEVYTNHPDRKGFKYEPWHFSYAPISIPMLQSYRALDIKSILQQENIEGSEHFTDDFIASYRKDNILDVNPSLL